ncbi:hypothetical protein BP6252_13131 [Coleophoma cylindrospora]|uniref:mannan endo-1,4-beta-mannosidase n=1 Tax=Coleophoma cylindrospora TaxID=1849047 RepID=A0A3D8Q9Y9_9HELO|nr:hypothetical protein BP6252_13131 [Coleophoma cylindrospora]
MFYILVSWFLLGAFAKPTPMLYLPVLNSSRSNSFAGSNNYYLHGLSLEDQTTYIKGLQNDGAKLVRLWITGIKSNCTKSSSTTELPNYETTIGEYNTELLNAIDDALVQLNAAGIKAIISPHDANLLPPNGTSTGYNGIDIYGTTYQSSFNFYTDAVSQANYDARLASILNYVSPNFNKKWADLSEVIMAFDIQNEPMIASPDLLTGNDPSDWLCNRATMMKSIIQNSGVGIATGGIGGSQYAGHEYNLLQKALDCPAIDIMSVHGYMSTKLQWTPYIPELSDQAAAAGKLCMLEEWGVTTGSGVDSVEKQAALFNQYGIPWLYWMVILGKSVDQSCAASDSACCHSGLSTDSLYDYEISLTSSRADFNMLFHNSSSVTAYQDWSKYT